jgi:nucleoside-diphosphate-sugar epimerase
MNILVTGAAGFLGQALIRKLESAQLHRVTGSVRKVTPGAAESSRLIAVGDLAESTDWTDALVGVDVVVHLAARAHILDGGDDLSEFDRVNVRAALGLAEQALRSGVRRFVFISSIGVNGAQTEGKAFDEYSPDAPHAIYAESKQRAEELLRNRLWGSAMELVIIRPPLVYAGHAPGNFQRLLKLVASGMPLPFGLTNNQRSMVSLNNLADFISLCIDHPAAANEVFLISDGSDVSTKEIVSFLAEGMGQKPRLFPVPDFFVRCAAAIVRKPALYTQLFRSLVIDSSKARTLLGWVPLQSPADALREAGECYKLQQTGSRFGSTKNGSSKK